MNLGLNEMKEKATVYSGELDDWFIGCWLLRSWFIGLLVLGCWFRTKAHGAHGEHGVRREGWLIGSLVVGCWEQLV
jgi:hypothetical protein